MRRAAALLAAAALGASAALAAPSGHAVVVVLKDGGERRARCVRTVPPATLVLTLEGGGEQRIALASVAAVRFQPPRWRDRLVLIRNRPFEGPGLARLKGLGAEEAARRAAVLFRRVQEEKAPARRIQQALNLAALRHRAGDLSGCREALRLLKAIAQEAGDREAYDEACVRLAALQLPAEREPYTTRSEAWKACDSELLSDVQDRGQVASLRARIAAIERLSAQAGP